MSLPPGFLDELRTRTSLAQVAGRKVMWDTRKSNQGKGDLWAPCPFHQEKTASFHVDDRKGFYYCFGCHAKGDAISFVRETENVDFMEAVRILAGEAGMQLPERDPQAQEKADRRTQLAEVMEMAVQHFRLSLKTGAGAAARDYLAGRGLDEAAQERFEIGFAADAWQGLWDHLKNKGVEDQMILDPRGRCIAFGGRAMDPGDNAKYLNSPETELFDKSRTLYHHGPAREAAGKGQPLIVAEGYMDVIALALAGFGASVAPLGTAVTEHQLQMLWRIADEPIIALDGDTAGLRAAYRVIDIALPLLEAGKSLRFAIMPEGQDPDDLLRAKGASAVQALLDDALPMVQLLWQRETEGHVYDSPERKAALDKALREKIKLIRDPSIRGHYGQALKEMRWQLFSPRRDTFKPGAAKWNKGGGRWQPIPTAMPSTKSSLLVAADDAAQIRLREAAILASLVCTPEVFEEFEAQIEMMTCTDPEHATLRDAILRHAPAGAETLRAHIEQMVGAEALENLLRLPHVALAPPVRRPGDAEVARMTIAAELAKLSAERGWNAEVSEAAEDLAGWADEALTWRLGQAAEERQRALRNQTEDRAQYDLAENGARISRDEREQFDALLEKIRYTKPTR